MKKSCLIALVLFLVSGSLWAQGKVLLRYKPQKGQTYIQNIENLQEVEAMGQLIPQGMGVTSKTTVLSVAANGDIELENVIEKFKSKSISFTGMIDYDSEDPAKQNGPEELKAIKGKKTRMKQNSRGKVISTDDPTMEQMMSSVSNEYPEQPVGVGDTWTQSSKLASMMGEIEIVTIYKVKARDKGIMEITISGVFKKDGKDIGMQEGFMKVEEASGLPLEMESKQNLNVSTMGQEAKVKGDVKMKIVK